MAFQQNDDEAANQFAACTYKKCTEDGITFELKQIDSKDPVRLKDAVQEANNDENVHGIMIYYPTIKGFEPATSCHHTSELTDDYFRNMISYQKDVEGLCRCHNLLTRYPNKAFGDLWDSRKPGKNILPCTALSIYFIIKHCLSSRNIHRNTVSKGRIVTIINRSHILGRPLASLLANCGYYIYSIDTDLIYCYKDGETRDISEQSTLKECVEESSIIISAVPSKTFCVPTRWVAPESLVINVSSYNNFEVESILGIPGVIFVPSVGKVTVSVLEQNMVNLYKAFHDKETRN